jgi:pimeloyl-ACP methyl ester carboxylesterase
MVTDILTPKRRISEPRLSEARANSPWTECGSLATAYGEIAYWSAGTGSPVLLVHGWEGTHADLEACVAPLVASGRRAVAPDLRAHGESDGTTASLYDLAENVREIGAHFGPFEGAIAHSAGSPAVAMAIAGGMVARRVALIAPPLNYERFVRDVARALDIEGDALVAAFLARGVDVTRLDMPRTAAELDVPALIVHSADDRVTACEGGQAVAKAWRGSTFRGVDGLGHRRILRDPETIAAILRFILDQPSPP